MPHEDEKVVDWFSAPGDSIRARMHYLEVTAEKLADRLDGGITEVRGLLSGQHCVTIKSATVLSDILGGTQEFWLRRQENFNNALDLALSAALNCKDDWIKDIPMPSTRNSKSINEKTLYKEIRRRMLFYNVPTYSSWEQRYGKICRNTHFRRSGSFTPLETSVLRWLRLGEIEADLIHTKSWCPQKLEDQLPSIRNLTKISKPERFLPKLRSLCAQAGVAVVIGKTPIGNASSKNNLPEPF